MTKINIEKLYYQKIKEQVSLEKAIEHFQDRLQVANALVYSPKYCKLLKLDEYGKLTNYKGNEISLNYQTENIFEARIFNENYELRWLQENDGKGTAVIISEQELNEDEDVIDTIEQEYLLWGEKAATKLEQGWQRLSTARIGAIDIFVNESHQNMSKNQRIYLHTREYLGYVNKDEDKKHKNYGNVGVFEERLVKLEVK